MVLEICERDFQRRRYFEKIRGEMICARKHFESVEFLAPVISRWPVGIQLQALVALLLRCQKDVVRLRTVIDKTELSVL